MEDKIYIDCIGVDRKIHVCEPHKNTCKCGVKVLDKKVLNVDKYRYSCYECTY